MRWREGDEVQLGREISGGVRQRPHRSLVGGNEDRARALAGRACGTGEVRHQPRQEALRRTGEGKGFVGLGDALEVDHAPVPSLSGEGVNSSPEYNRALARKRVV